MTDGRASIRKLPNRGKEVNTVNTILDNIEEILDGIDLEVIDMPVYDLPDYLAHTADGGGGC
jgi:hypothetical protein